MAERSLQGFVTDIFCRISTTGQRRYQMTIDIFCDDHLPKLNFSKGVTITPNDHGTSPKSDPTNQDRKLDL